MALSYLSGDLMSEISGRKKKSKSERKEDRKKVTKKVAKFTLAESRAAVLTVCDLNFLKFATKLARVYKATGGKAKLQNWWEKFGGNFSHLQKAIAKGSKQQISGDEIGVALEVVMATALPVIAAVWPIIKEFKASGDKSEEKEFDDGMGDAYKEAGSNPDIAKGKIRMTVGTKVGVAPTGGKQSSMDKGKTPDLGSFISPIGIFFKTPMMLAVMNFSNPIIIGICQFINTYCILGMLILVMSMFSKNKKFGAWYWEVPVNAFYSVGDYFTNKFLLLWPRKS